MWTDRDDIENEVRSLQDQNQELQGTIDDMEGEKDELHTMIENLKEKVKVLTRQQKKSEHTINKLELQVTNLKDEIYVLQEQIQCYKNKEDDERVKKRRRLPDHNATDELGDLPL